MDARTEYGIFLKFLDSAESLNIADPQDSNTTYEQMIQKTYGNAYCNQEHISKATAWLNTFMGTNNDKQK